VITIEAVMQGDPGVLYPRDLVRSIVGDGTTVQQILDLETHPINIVRILTCCGELPDRLLRLFAVACVALVSDAIPDPLRSGCVASAIQAAKDHANGSPVFVLDAAWETLIDVKSEQWIEAFPEDATTNAWAFEAAKAAVMRSTKMAAWEAASAASRVRMKYGLPETGNVYEPTTEKAWTEILNLLKREIER